MKSCGKKEFIVLYEGQNPATTMLVYFTATVYALCTFSYTCIYLYNRKIMCIKSLFKVPTTASR